jgi:hypothetical protein
VFLFLHFTLYLSVGPVLFLVLARLSVFVSEPFALHCTLYSRRTRTASRARAHVGDDSYTADIGLFLLIINAVDVI